jgi:hypothetical protein
LIIRHGEKPADPPRPNGVDIDGNVDDHSLAPVGWQRAGGLVGLFAPLGGAQRPGILTPGKLYSPGYGSAQKTAAERTYETIFPLSQLLGLSDRQRVRREQGGADRGRTRATTVVWSFVRPAGSSSDPYVFCQIPQMLLWGDLDTPTPT